MYDKKIQKYGRRQKQLLSIIAVLQKEGVDIARIYSDIVDGKIEVGEEENLEIAR